MTDRYAVIGNPIAHSKSPQIHAAFAAQTGQDMEYTRLLAPLTGIRDTVAAFRTEGGNGLNITLPFKVEALQIAGDASERARYAGAANFLQAKDDGWFADNTDGAGLVRDLEANLGYVIAGARVLLIGAGGAARGAILPLLAAKPGSFTIVNRTAHTAIELAQTFAERGPDGIINGGGFASVTGEQFDLVINATSASLAGAIPALSDGAFAAGSLGYDMMYGDEPTPFMTMALQHGALEVADGLGMLVEQAAESFYLWRGVRPETTGVLEMLRLAG
jgi:shikimate dehydrogenase